MIFGKPEIFKKITGFYIIKRSIDFVFSVIMANNTLGEWSDGENEWTFEIDEDEILRRLDEGEWNNSKDDEATRNINVDEILRGLFGNGDLERNIDEGTSDSEEDEQISGNNEILVISSDSEEDEPISSDSQEDEPISNIDDEGSNSEDELECEQTGRGEKRKAQNQNEEQEQDYYQIKPVRDHHSQKFNMTSKNYGVRFNNVLHNVDLLESRKRTYGIFDRLLEDVTEGMNPNDQVRFVLSSNQLQTPIALPFCSLEELTTEKVLSHVEKVVQSNEEFRLNDTVNIDVIRVEMPQGSGRRKRDIVNIRDYLKKKKSVITINNRDNLCLARSLVTSIARIEKDPRYRGMREGNGIQRERAFDLHELFQQHLVNYQIIVVSGDQNNSIIYPYQPPPNPNPEKSIYLYYQANHFDVITTLPGFLSRGYFCHTCHKAYDHTTDHLCNGMCHSCRGFDCYLQGDGIVCNECDRLFKNQLCYNRHKEQPIDGGGRVVCEAIRKCPTCKKSMDVRKITAKGHECVDRKCPTCKIERNPEDLNHKCYMQQLEPNEESSYNHLLFFDFECTQERAIHEVNLCVVYDEEKEVGVFRGKNAVKDFCNWLLTPEHQDCIVMAHNFQGYDSYPIMKYLNENAIEYDVVYNGAKCVTLTTENKKKRFRIKFMDSLNFIPMALAKFPKTFAQPELCKGYFPHFFNKDENQDYVGPIPCQDDYGVNFMKPAAREAFMTWHQQQVDNNYVFDFRHEILEYCRSDVDILAECCKLYREMFRGITSMDGDAETGMDPFDTATTIAGYCMQVYRTKFLEKDTIALLPQHQQLKRNQSHEALQWLSYTAEKEEIRIQHDRNGGEKRVGNYYLDGYCKETHTAYEYQGCYWHGKDFL